MRALKLGGAMALACFLTLSPAQARHHQLMNIRPARAAMANIVIAAAHRHHVPVALAYAVAETESSFDPNARSSVGAIGLMQVRAGTARDAGCHGSLFNPVANAECGVHILAQLLRDTGGNWRAAAAHYNCGRYARPGAGANYAAQVLSRARRA